MGGVEKLVEQALRWPTFLYSIFLLYWSTALVTLAYSVEALNFKHKRNDVLGWCAGMKLFFRFTVLKVGARDLYHGKCIYLCNHRSWADFMVDQYVTEGRSLFMSRWTVFFVFPTFMGPIKAIRCVILFKRGSIADKQAFNNWIDQQFSESPQPAIAVYPEGHRSTHGESLPLKRGMLHYAYSRKLPVQAVIGANKEAILSEKHRTARFGQTVAVGYSEVVDPAKYDKFEAFMARVQAVWDHEWRTVFSSNFDELPVLPAPRPTFDIPLFLRVRMLLCVVPVTCLFFVMLSYSWRATTWALGLLGPLQPVVVALLALYLGASFYLANEPYFSTSGRCEAPTRMGTGMSCASIAANGTSADEEKDKEE